MPLDPFFTSASKKCPKRKRQAPQHDDPSDAHLIGQMDFLDGSPACPFEPGSNDARLWLTGYNECLVRFHGLKELPKQLRPLESQIRFDSRKE